ncbi:MAG: hypothetical protein JNN07_17655 [Verrucomicrobiales bacterium]|nr:hypothetical protein [Verrucomicrobiales bacterium]
MKPGKLVRATGMLLILWLMLLSPAGRAAIPVEGVADKQTYTDSASLKVPVEAGYSYLASLNDQSFPLNTNVTLSLPDFYELRVERTSSMGSVEVRILRFLIADSTRVGTEWGLPTHIPSPSIPSAAQEFEGGRLRLLMPARLPMGLELPIVAWVEDSEGHALRVNGLVRGDELSGPWLRRGVGSDLLLLSGPARTLVYRARVAGLEATNEVVLEDSVVWLPANGILGAQTEWTSGSRIHVTGNLTVPAGGTLTIGAGTVVRLEPLVDITNNGRVLILGSRREPVVFVPAVANKPWGGFTMRAGTGEIDGTGVVFVGSGGDPHWFSKSGNPGSHRKEQALFFVNDDQRVRLTDSAAISLAGQLGHSVKGGLFEFNHFLMQRATSGGEFTGAQFRVNDSAFIECPSDTAAFVDGDNDALYLVSGDHGFTNTLFGWTKDDGVDSGGSGAAKLRYQSCWFESIFHEGNSLSGAKDVMARDTVYFDCGQGLEDGYDAPIGVADHCLFLANQVGVRHGDNYPSIGRYDGRITATNCLILNNHRDVFGFNWRSSGWTNATGQMLVQDNWLTRANEYFPANRIWSPAEDANRLAVFGAREVVGAGFATRGSIATASELQGGLPVRLSMACLKPVVLRYLWQTDDGRTIPGVLSFAPGEIQARLPIAPAWAGFARARLVEGDQAEISGRDVVFVQRVPERASQLLVARGSVWKYRDNAQDLGQAWKLLSFSDEDWPQGPSPMGYGDGPEGTMLKPSDSGPEPRPLTYYFRTHFGVTTPQDIGSLRFAVRRDDGVAVYLNGVPLFRMNMPDLPELKYGTPASGSVTDETSYFPTNVSSSFLVAGDNLLAVELHQSSATSGDAHFDLELEGLPVSAPVRLEWVVWGREGYLMWNQESAVLKESASLLGPWLPVPMAARPYRLPEDGPTRFYRLE